MRLHHYQSVNERLSSLILLLCLTVAVTATLVKSDQDEDLCGSDAVSVATCALCPNILGENALKCCRDARTFADCTVSVISALEGIVGDDNGVKDVNGMEQQTGGDIDKRAKYFLGKRAKYFLGKRSFGDRSSYYDWRPAMRHETLGQDFYYPARRVQPYQSNLDKRAKYFLGK